MGRDHVRRGRVGRQLEVAAVLRRRLDLALRNQLGVCRSRWRGDDVRMSPAAILGEVRRHGGIRGSARPARPPVAPTTRVRLARPASAGLDVVAVDPGSGVVVPRCSAVGTRSAAPGTTAIIPDQCPIQTLSPHGAHPALRVRVRARSRAGILTTSIPAEPNTASNAVNFASLSRIRYRNRCPCSPRSISRFRACCATQAPLEWAVIPARCTDRRCTSTKNNTYSRVRPTISTVKKSVASSPLA